jgi:hypothetical protein
MKRDEFNLGGSPRTHQFLRRSTGRGEGSLPARFANVTLGPCRAHTLSTEFNGEPHCNTRRIR